ncbi:hypothetical protein GT348_08465 [Aristophania vespae]|uniref:CHAD domain-containing protein n=1 Tax=Aristophania vespae TaxID=2697033 RepID=A0A6P1NKT7_9PROT|nr:hypothetical protein [Aristophania vespae]QHI96252.1 hypothetical protein GT348_08465 [Aristophania vespae]
MRPSLEKTIFPQKTLDTVFEHVLLDDVINLNASLSDEVIEADYTAEEIEASYDLCWQLLERGVDFEQFRSLIAKIAFTGSATEEERLAFKYARARFKHMRFACNNFDKRHRYPKLFHKVIILMGKMQDAFKNTQRFATLIYGLILWLILSPSCYWLIARELTDFRAESPAGLRAYHRRENQKLEKLFKKQNKLAAHDFHLMRKIISRRVAFNDTLRTIRPSPKLDRFSAYLATMNGIMGDMHDELVEKRYVDKQGYYKNSVPFPGDLAERIQCFLNKEKQV